MSQSAADPTRLLENEFFPISSGYDGRWVMDNEMGPSALWRTEWVCRDLFLSAGMRVLDMGCGRCFSSVFLAREFGVHVWATDLWVSPTENWKRIREAGLQDQIIPMQAEARALPYAHGFFDTILCIDSYFYYGTDDLYLKYFQQFVKAGGQIGLATPGLMRDFEAGVPEHLEPFWSQDCWGWHTPEWWRQLWDRTGLVEIETVEAMPDGWRHWLQFYNARRLCGPREMSPSDIQALEADQGRYVGFIKMVAHRKEVDKPGCGARM